MQIYFWKHVLIIVAMTASVCCLAQSPSLLTEIRHDSAIEVFLTTDWNHLEKKKREKAYQQGQLLLITRDQDSIIISAKIRTRGHMRLDICSFPPLKIKMNKEKLAENGLSGFNEADIVHHCHKGETFEQLILREYLAYKLWELVSPYYFRVQMLKLHYTNEDGSTAYDPAYAFLVEHTEELVDRLGARENKTPVMSKNAIDKEPMIRVALFQYMIGNTDWFIVNRHNLEFVGIPGHQFLVAIPYDFDYSGLVDAPYAAHHESLSLPSVEMRYYQGWCHTEEEVEKVLLTFHEQKENILSLPSRIPGLDERSVKYTTAYLQGFFEIIESPQKLKNQVVRHCDMWPVNN